MVGVWRVVGVWQGGFATAGDNKPVKTVALPASFSSWRGPAGLPQAVSHKSELDAKAGEDGERIQIGAVFAY